MMAMVLDMIRSSLTQFGVIPKETLPQTQAQSITMDPESPQIVEPSVGVISDSEQEGPDSGTPELDQLMLTVEEQLESDSFYGLEKGETEDQRNVMGMKRPVYHDPTRATINLALPWHSSVEEIADCNLDILTGKLSKRMKSLNPARPWGPKDFFSAVGYHTHNLVGYVLNLSLWLYHLSLLLQLDLVSAWGDRIKTLIALSEPYQCCSRSSARTKHIDSGLVVYQRLFPFSRSE